MAQRRPFFSPSGAGSGGREDESLSATIGGRSGRAPGAGAGVFPPGGGAKATSDGKPSAGKGGGSPAGVWANTGRQPRTHNTMTALRFFAENTIE